MHIPRRPTWTARANQVHTFSMAAQAAPGPADAPIFYNVRQHGTPNEFQQSPQFAAFRQEYEALLDRIVGFAKENSARIKPQLKNESVQSIEDAFLFLKGKIFVPAQDNSESKDIALMYSEGKKILHEFARLLHTPIPFQTSVEAVCNLSQNADECTNGFYLQLQEEVSRLKTSQSGTKGVVYRFKYQMANNLILQYMRDQKITVGDMYETHYVAAFYNHLAASVGLHKKEDAYLVDQAAEISKKIADHLEGCKAYVTRKLHPSALVNAVASEYIDKVRGVADSAGIEDLAAPIPGAAVAPFFQSLHAVKMADLDASYGELPASTYVTESDQMPLSYTMAQSRAPLKAGLWRQLKKEDLVDFKPTVVAHLADGTIYSLGKDFWLEHDGACTEVQSQHFFSVSPAAIVKNLQRQGIGGHHLAEMLKSTAIHLFTLGLSETAQQPSMRWMQDFAQLCKQHAPDAFGQLDLAVMLAAAYRDIDALGGLLDGTSNLHAADAQGRTPLMHFARHGNCHAMQTLVEADSARPPLSKVLRSGALRRSPDLLGALDVDGFSAVMHACDIGQPRAVEYLLSAGADTRHAEPDEGFNALQLACHQGCAQSVAALAGVAKRTVLSNGQRLIDCVNLEGDTAVVIALSGQHVEALRELAYAGADLDKADEEGNTPVMLAAQDGHIEALGILIAHGAHIDAANTSNRTALMLASYVGEFDAVKALVQAGANVNTADNNGNTAVIDTAEFDREEILELLVNEAKADLHVRNALGHNALMMAAKMGHPVCLAVLLDAGAVADEAHSIDGTTALMFASQNQNDAAMQLLTDAGADISLRCRQGLTAHDYYVRAQQQAATAGIPSSHL
jgi:uncharacterized protein